MWHVGNKEINKKPWKNGPMKKTVGQQRPWVPRHPFSYSISVGGELVKWERERKRNENKFLELLLLYIYY
jgi:hypothetical protein